MAKKDNDMSDTFISEVGQKSAVAGENTISLEDVKDELNKNESPEVDFKKEEPLVQPDKINQDNNKNKPKKRNPIGIIFLMILCLLVGAGGTYYYFEIMNKEENNTIKSSAKEENKEEELNPDGLFVHTLIENYDFYLISNIEIFDHLYVNDKTEVKDIEEYYLRNLAGIKAQKSLDNTGFSSEEFQNAVTLLFGQNVVLENKDLSDNKEDSGRCYSYKYNEESKYYEVQQPSGCGGTTTLSLERKIVKATKKKEQLEINVAIAIEDSETKKIYNLYKDGTGVSDEVVGITLDSFDIDKDYEKLNQYQYKFEYDQENNNYYLVSIKRVK